MIQQKPSQNKLMKIIRMPIKALAKARDFYVRTMSKFADSVTYGTASLGGTVYSDPLPRSFSTSSIASDDSVDFKELVRAASTRSLGNRIGLNHPSLNGNNNNFSQLKREMVAGNLRGVPRSASVGMAKIEEDKPSEIGETGIKQGGVGNVEKNGSNVESKKKKFQLFPRSKTYAGGSAKKALGIF